MNFIKNPDGPQMPTQPQPTYGYNTAPMGNEPPNYPYRPQPQYGFNQPPPSPPNKSAWPMFLLSLISLAIGYVIGQYMSRIKQAVISKVNSAKAIAKVPTKSESLDPLEQHRIFRSQTMPRPDSKIGFDIAETTELNPEIDEN